MKAYRTNNNVKVLASRPQDADAEFLEEAYKYGFRLYRASMYDTRKEKFEEEVPYFGDFEGFPKVIKFQYLILFGEGECMVASEKVFNSMFFEIGDASLPTNMKLQGKTIWIDAGHGGKDPGAINNDLQEKDAALHICLLLGEALMEQGARCLYSRMSDYFLEVSTRAKEANDAKADAFISIHLNSAENRYAVGTETLVFSTSGEAYKLASAIQKNIIAATGFKNRGVKSRPGLGVLRLTNMPAVLVECGFISNDAEARKLFQETCQHDIANAICAGIVEVMGV